MIYRKARKREAINEGAGLLLKLEDGYRDNMQQLWRFIVL